MYHVILVVSCTLQYCLYYVPYNIVYIMYHVILVVSCTLQYCLYYVPFNIVYIMYHVILFVSCILQYCLCHMPLKFLLPITTCLLALVLIALLCAFGRFVFACNTL